MIKTIKRSLISTFRNLPGKSVGKKIVVIECDDWGSRGVPSIEAYQKLKAAGLPMDSSRYARFDTLASAQDLEALFEVLSKHKDVNGNPAVVSPFFNTANPDFEVIKTNGFTKYVAEPVMDTIKKYAQGDVLTQWKQGSEAKIWSPEYHGREHLATAMWLKALQSGDEKVRTAFDYHFASYSPPGTPKAALNFRPNFYVTSGNDIPSLKADMENGIELFYEAFGFYPTVFNAPNGVFIDGFDQYLLEKGIQFNAVPRQRLDRAADGQYRYRTFRTGEKSANGMTCYVRNCNFEPTERSYAGINHILSQIQGAFICGKAAIIGTHRVNFVGGMDEKNRSQGLKELNQLLLQILKRWPDTLFMSSKDFTKLL
ncbi:hypothetical protein [Pedobacter sp. SL55]|uniref:hypothetical protein n=1 Tax=Pedobacter sp. SL55 TaxID=2995161 RepID=UPI002270A65D|nr:hypothetical protein [Pedobacter sp. SL55]WAC40200.1 hypothetical protein OVA16_16730 [Pedobacter sp. SL55]